MRRVDPDDGGNGRCFECEHQLEGGHACARLMLAERDIMAIVAEVRQQGEQTRNTVSELAKEIARLGNAMAEALKKRGRK